MLLLNLPLPASFCGEYAADGLGLERGAVGAAADGDVYASGETTVERRDCGSEPSIGAACLPPDACAARRR